MRESSESSQLIASVVSRAAKIVSEMAGIQLGDRQMPMVENRLKSRMLKLRIKSFENYLEYLNQHQESESQALLSLLTTHHSFFFREFTHFEFLLNKGLARLIAKARTRSDKTIRIWSAACSRGQEVYSLAMFFKFHLAHIAPDVKFEIWGTDIDPESVKFAQNAVYKNEELRQSPAMYMEGHWTRGSGRVENFSKAKDDLVQHCRFGVANLQSCRDFLKDKKFDLIFCRNVFIYFSPEQIRQITKTFMNHIDQDGFLFLGVSETLNGLGLDVDVMGPSVYGHKIKAVLPAAPSKVAVRIAEKAPEPPKPLEVLCIDDSPVIHTLLARILVQEQGFRITAKAANGREALEILKKKKFDVITLDMHMPELDGVGFLKEYKDRSAPVLILSSINRDDPSIAQKALALGASDYVEKPSLENLAQAGNEIRSKLALLSRYKKTA